MITDSYYPARIPLDSLKKDQLNTIKEGVPFPVVVYFLGQEAKVALDFCPHMGAPLSDGAYDAKKGELRCPWHGYDFNAQDGAFKHNPNDRIFGCMKHLYKNYTPGKESRLRLRHLDFEIIDGHICIKNTKKQGPS